MQFLLLIPAMVLVCDLAVSACAAAPTGLDPGPMTRAEARERAGALEALGRKMFFDPSLSASGQQACASCHDPAHAFGPAGETTVMPGGPDMKRPGERAVPALRYLQTVPQFTEHYFESDDEGDESIDAGPTGGLTWDGGADTFAAQARIPLFAPHEMANKDEGALAKALGAAPYAADIKALFGAAIFTRPSEAVEAATRALAAFQQVPAQFYPYSSRYDAFLAGKAELSEQEKRGLAAFADPGKGNCSSCHVSARSRNGLPPQFTDYGFIAIAVPRNPAIAANADPAYADLGLCGPTRRDLAGKEAYCGLFRTPSLRNVALKGSFFHNGAVHSLREAVAFYATRDSDPAHWYGKDLEGKPRLYDDLPRRYWGNINKEPPFRADGETTALSETDIDDIVAFLKTLTDADLVPKP